MGNWFKKAQDWQSRRYSGVILAEVTVPFGGADREYEMVARSIAYAMDQAEKTGRQLGVAFKFTPQGDYEKVSL